MIIQVQQLRRYLVSAVVVSVLFTAGCRSDDSRAKKHETNSHSIFMHIRELGLDSLDHGLRVYYPPGYQDRAASLGPVFHDAVRYLNDSLNANLEIRVALLDRTVWKQVRSIPYGLPFVEYSADPPVVGLPADGEGAVYAFIRELGDTLPVAKRDYLAAHGYTWDQASRRMVDFIGFHEIGHAYEELCRISSPAQWFSEFLASYFAYLYLYEEQPEMAVVWEVTGEVILRGHMPAHRTLEEFETLYTRVGVPDYAWYQTAFQGLVNRMVKQYGFDFIYRAQQLFSRGGDAMSPEEVVVLLTKRYPEFREWATIFTEQG